MSVLDKSALEVLQPLIDIANAYDASALDEARPEWSELGHKQENPDEIELFSGRGGKRLLTLQHCFDARSWARERGLI